MINISPALQVSAFTILNKRTCVLSEKNLEDFSFVLCEELLRNGVPFCIIDSEGAFKNLKIMYELLWVGDEKSDLEMHCCDFKKLAQTAVSKSIPIVLDVSKIEKHEKYLEKFFDELLQTSTEYRRPYLIVINHAEKYLNTDNSVESLKEIAMMKTGRGLGMVMFSNKPSLMDRNVLHYCSNRIIGKISREEDLKTVRFMHSEEMNKPSELEDNEYLALGGLGTGTSIRPRKRMINEKTIRERDIITSVKLMEIAAGLRVERIFETEKVRKRISKEDSKNYVNLKKKYLFFGEEVEDVKKISEVAKKVARVIVEDSGEEITLLFNAGNGIPYHYDNTLKELKELDLIMQLTTDEASVMRIISSEGPCNTQLIKDRTGMKQENLNRVISELLKRNVISRIESEESLLRTQPSFPIIPKIKALQSEIVGETEPSEEKSDVNDDAIIKFVKQISPGASVKEIKILLYPFYKVEIASYKPRTVIIDAVTGVRI